MLLTLQVLNIDGTNNSFFAPQLASNFIDHTTEYLTKGHVASAGGISPLTGSASFVSPSSRFLHTCSLADESQ
jgi:hypothetical protein